MKCCRCVIIVGMVESLEQKVYSGKVLSIVWLNGARDCFLTSGPAGQVVSWKKKCLPEKFSNFLDISILFP